VASPKTRGFVPNTTQLDEARRFQHECAALIPNGPAYGVLSSPRISGGMYDDMVLYTAYVINLARVRK
jgi:hypothetical protein